MRIGCLAVHYGKEYLGWAVRSLIYACDEIHVFYVDRPSFGFAEGVVCPDTREQLISEAGRFTNIVKWHDVVASSEGSHRNLMFEEATRRGAKLMAVLDSDEVWDPGGLKTAFDAVEAANRAGRWLVRFHHFWRSWKWTLCGSEGMRPVRILDLRNSQNVDAYLDEIVRPDPIYHFGYAQSLPIMNYKFTCHGHKAEFSPGWFERKFVPWTPAGDHEDLHPSVNVWHKREVLGEQTSPLWTARPTPVEVLARVQMLMPEHPHRDLEIIA